MEKVNANLVLCKKYDKENGSITQIFDTINLTDNERQSFDIAMIFSGMEHPFDRMKVYYLIYRVDEFSKEESDNIKILTTSNLKRIPGEKQIDGKGRKCTFSNSFDSIVKVEVKNVKFKRTGVYEIRAYGFESDEEYKKNFTVDEIINQEDKLLCFKNFEVRNS